MQRWLAMVMSALAVLAIAAGPAQAQADTPDTAVADAPIPRDYPEASLIRARPGKPAEQYAREEAAANAAEAACNAGAIAACADLGRAFNFGEGRPQNRPVAELLYRKACAAADGAGCFDLAQLLEQTRTASDERQAAVFYARGCRLGVLESCEAEADVLEAGTQGQPDPAAAETLRRTTCTAGSNSACRTLASRLLSRERSDAERAEAVALLDRLCRANDLRACSDIAIHWRGIENGDGPRTLEYYTIGCNAGDAGSCRSLGRHSLDQANGPDAAPQRIAAQAFYDRACTLEALSCDDANDLRVEPLLASRCENQEAESCTAYAALIDRQGRAREAARALAMLGKSCEAGNDVVCLIAARLVFEQWQATDTPDPGRAALYLERSCQAGTRDACERLADELASGDRFPQNIQRASELYSVQCEAERITACRFLMDLAETDPTAPLMLAGDAYRPELTPEEAEEERRLLRAENERKRAEERAQKCTTTTVEWQDVLFTDTLCDNIQRVIRGFAVGRGTAPWQALIWRPEKLGSLTLTPAERVLCGGSVIREGWILTAAHCLTDEGGVSIATGGHRVRLGLNNPLTGEGFSYPIIKAIPHPDFKRKVLAFDIALVQYDPARGIRGGGAVIPPARIRLDPMPLEARRLEALDRVTTYGWGVTKVGTGLVPDHLRGARLRLRDAATCTDITKFTDIRRNSVICADDTRLSEGGQACSGDSGGPLISFGGADPVPTVIGVVSGGVECGTAGKPSRYTRVAHPLVQKWLRDTLPPAGTRQTPVRSR